MEINCDAYCKDHKRQYWKKNGVVIRLEQMFERHGSLRRKLISCQHHVLDRILSLVMDG